MHRPFKLILGLALSTFAAWALGADALQVRSMAASCAACHGTHGVAQPGMATLAGQSKEELLKKLTEFKSGARPATLMHQLSRGYSDEQLEQLAGYFAALKE